MAILEKCCGISKNKGAVKAVDATVCPSQFVAGVLAESLASTFLKNSINSHLTLLVFEDEAYVLHACRSLLIN